MRLLNAFRIDAPLPPSGLTRWATILGMAFGGLVAMLVVVFMGVLLFSG
ncbi:MAG: hypothetical protein IPO09_21840 [Anaeromyxobacter sp.]|nr:hypothetical protein [Anaeromyxobacter sp.]MBL0274596.1 hypothetical protein [Anaeromyxobacter sp.]